MSHASLVPAASDLNEALPGPEVRERLLARASLTLGEARALVRLLDELEPPVWGARGETSNRSAFGYQPVMQPPPAIQP